MDLLQIPPGNTTGEKALYLCTETWDGGVFQSYAARKQQLRLFPQALFQLHQTNELSPSLNKTTIPTLSQVQPFLQSWLFVGLICEFLGLNALPNASDSTPSEDMTGKIDQVHKQCIIEQDGTQYLTGNVVIERAEEIWASVRSAPHLLQRLIYLRDCLRVAVIMLHTIEVTPEHSVRYSIASLGELLTTALYSSASLATPRIELPIVGFNWNKDYIQVGGVVEARMLGNGWCPSEIAKVRSQFSGLNTMHYLSLLEQDKSPQDHEFCSMYLCKAFQIDMATYVSKHTTDDCSCRHIKSIETEMQHVLQSSDSFPVLKVDYGPSLDDIQITVDTYGDGVEYVAFSHVWAEGLGNPFQCSLPRCQVARIASLVASLSQSTNAVSPYYIWIDTLCCPVNLSGKKIALGRIADVYRKARHVLILDSLLYSLPSQDTPASLLLKLFGASPWMRRLWTLQEGALAESLFVQFADGAHSVMSLLEQLFVQAKQDARIMRIWQDLMGEFNHLQSFRQPTTPSLISLQRAIHYRTVTIDSDEALCIATLMRLDSSTILDLNDAGQRMAEMWRLLAIKLGSLPSRMMFYVDEPVNVLGWSWAPRSLLASSSGSANTAYGLEERVERFWDMEDDPSTKGIPTSLGLRVSMSGFLIHVAPHGDGGPLDPWPGLLNSIEDRLVVYNESQSRWYSLIDWYRGRKIGVWTDEERRAYDAKVKDPLRRSINTNNCALLLDPRSAISDTTVACMVQVVNTLDSGDVVVRRERTVILSPLTEKEGRLMHALAKVAKDVALDQHTTTGVRDAPDETCLESLRHQFKQMTKRVSGATPGFEEDVAETMGDVGEYLWVVPPKLFKNRMSKTSVQQIWIVQ